jgi:hypothetical protein
MGAPAEACGVVTTGTHAPHDPLIIFSIRPTNFGWAHPNRVLSQAVSKSLRPGIQSLERSAKCTPQPGDSRSSRRVWTLRAFQKKRSLKKQSKKLGSGWKQGFRYYERAGERHERTQAVALKEWWAGLHSAERQSEFTAAGRRAGSPINLHQKFGLAESMAVPNLSSNPSKV